MVAVTNLRSGTIFKDGGQPFVVLKYSHVKMGRGNAVVKIKAKNLRNGSVIERSFLSGSSLEEADVEKTKVQFLYQSVDRYFFMDGVSFEQFELTRDFLGESIHFLKEGVNCDLIKFDGVPVSLELPLNVVLKVKEAGSGFKGDSVASVTKTVTLETGLKVEAPNFINEGDLIKVDTRDGSYRERA